LRGVFQRGEKVRDDPLSPAWESPSQMSRLLSRWGKTGGAKNGYPTRLRGVLAHRKDEKNKRETTFMARDARFGKREKRPGQLLEGGPEEKPLVVRRGRSHYCRPGCEERKNRQGVTSRRKGRKNVPGVGYKTKPIKLRGAPREKTCQGQKER